MLAPNTLLQGRYLVLQPIGQGGMGEVYLAIDQRLGSAVALKRTFFTENQALKQAFEREARILARLRHPVLPKVTDTFTEETNQYIVMEYISGDDLGKKLFQHNRPFPVTQVADWADSLLDALDYLHTHEPPIIHRDIKPQNLKLTESNQIILLDFGLAKNSVAQTGQTSNPASVVGYTLAYAPLEQIRGTGTIPRSDLYALSATLYHFLTNVNPPDALLRASALVDGSPDPLRPIDEINPDVLPEVALVIQQGMALSADKRIPTAKDMRVLLREAMRGRRESMQAQTAVLSEIPAEVQKVISNQYETGRQSENYISQPTNITPNYVSNPAPPNYISQPTPPSYTSNPLPPNYVSTPNPTQQKTEVLQDFMPTVPDIQPVPNAGQFSKTEQLPNSGIPTENLPAFNQPPQTADNQYFTGQNPTYNPAVNNTNPNAPRTEQFAPPVNLPANPVLGATNASPTFAENVQSTTPPPRNLMQVDVPQYNSTPIIPAPINYTAPTAKNSGSIVKKGLLAVAVGVLGAIVVAATAGIYFFNPFKSVTANKPPTANTQIVVSPENNVPTPVSSPKTEQNSNDNKTASNNTVAETNTNLPADKPNTKTTPEKPVTTVTTEKPKPVKPAPIVTASEVRRPPVQQKPVEVVKPTTKPTVKKPDIQIEH